MLHAGCMGVFVVLTLVNGQQNQYWTKLSSIHPHPSQSWENQNQTNEPPPADTRPAHIHSNTDDMLFFFFSSKKSKGFYLEYFIFAKSDSSFSFIYHQPTHERVRQTWIVEFLLFYRSQVAGAVLDTAHNVQVSVYAVSSWENTCMNIVQHTRRELNYYLTTEPFTLCMLCTSRFISVFGWPAALYIYTQQPAPYKCV